MLLELARSDDRISKSTPENLFSIGPQLWWRALV
jgi:hypothetical protein